MRPCMCSVLYIDTSFKQLIRTKRCVFVSACGMLMRGISIKVH